MRASDKGFLDLDWRQYLALLRWAAGQPAKGLLAKTPEELRGILGTLGIEASRVDSEQGPESRSILAFARSSRSARLFFHASSVRENGCHPSNK